MGDTQESPDIQHVVVLMLENRSFDCMLGSLYASDGHFDGLTGTETNAWQAADGTAEPVAVWTDPSDGPALTTVPDPDPGELFTDIAEQMSAGGAMGGFVANYMRHATAAVPRDPGAVMHYFTPRHVPVISQLARAFGVCDRWHASAPCQTWPNRLFAHTGTAAGYVNNAPAQVPFMQDTVFQRLQAAGQSWRIYFHDIPQTATLGPLWWHPGNFRHFVESFEADAAAGDLPSYSFLEPRYFADLTGTEMPNDQHPPHDVAYGERLIATVYNALRAGPKWRQTLFILTYDEHGGCYDHVYPPAAVPPGGPYPDGFQFDRFGVRVPAVIVSPFVPAGSILRPPGQTPFDHTSIYRTLQELFGLASLTARSDAAPGLLGLLSAQAVNDGPARVAYDAPEVTEAHVAAAAAQPQNDLQASLSHAAVRLPTAGADVALHLDRMAGTALAQTSANTVGEAGADAVAHMRAFLGR